jgi:hypothetical protein
VAPAVATVPVDRALIVAVVAALAALFPWREVPRQANVTRPLPRLDRVLHGLWVLWDEPFRRPGKIAQSKIIDLVQRPRRRLGARVTSAPVDHPPLDIPEETPVRPVSPTRPIPLPNRPLPADTRGRAGRSGIGDRGGGTVQPGRFGVQWDRVGVR